jgi:hypothetical protein
LNELISHSINWILSSLKNFQRDQYKIPVIIIGSVNKLIDNALQLYAHKNGLTFITYQEAVIEFIESQNLRDCTVFDFGATHITLIKDKKIIESLPWGGNLITKRLMDYIISTLFEGQPLSRKMKLLLWKKCDEIKIILSRIEEVLQLLFFIIINAGLFLFFIT